MNYVKTKYIRTVLIQDPDTLEGVEIEVHKDPQSGALFGIDASFLDQIEDKIPSPFNEGTILDLSGDE